MGLVKQNWLLRKESAVARVIEEGKFKTYDMGGDTKTIEMAEAKSPLIFSIICLTAKTQRMQR
ncbi:MAG: hypothetical protein IPG53_11940 [Ignavibacteriales bacterium]|nr:hypothetical protein [Ignavibacteriales bacterium]